MSFSCLAQNEKKNELLFPCGRCPHTQPPSSLMLGPSMHHRHRTIHATPPTLYWTPSLPKTDTVRQVRWQPGWLSPVARRIACTKNLWMKKKKRSAATTFNVLFIFVVAPWRVLCVVLLWWRYGQPRRAGGRTWWCLGNQLNGKKEHRHGIFTTHAFDADAMCLQPPENKMNSRGRAVLNENCHLMFVLSVWFYYISAKNILWFGIEDFCWWNSVATMSVDNV